MQKVERIPKKISITCRSYICRREPGTASGFALGRSQKVRLAEKLRKMLQIKRLRLAKTKIEHKKQRFERLYYKELVSLDR
jgi:hypothetical protein